MSLKDNCMEFSIGSYIKELRSSGGKTLKDVAEVLNIDPANLSKIENGQRDFDLKKLPDLCDFLNIDYQIAKKEVFSEMIANNLIENGLGEDTLDLTRKKIFIYKERDTEALPIEDWRLKEFAHPKAKLRVGTLFSGIGAFESALKRLNIQHEIAFAGDIDPYVRKSYFANYNISEDNWHNDVTSFSAKKYKGQGVPALKLEMREGLNNKKDFMMLCARQARVDTSPLCQNKTPPISLKRAGEIMMDLTPLDPDMLRASRIRMYGIPRVILVPGQGLGVYDWSDNSLIIPIFGVVSDVKTVGFALAAFRWDNDEDRTLKDTFALLKQNKGKGIRGLQDQFSNDYFIWISKERKGYRILSKEVSKWFKAFFKQKSGTGMENRSPGVR